MVSTQPLPSCRTTPSPQTPPEEPINDTAFFNYAPPTFVPPLNLNHLGILAERPESYFILWGFDPSSSDPLAAWIDKKDVGWYLRREWHDNNHNWKRSLFLMGIRQQIYDERAMGKRATDEMIVGIVRRCFLEERQASSLTPEEKQLFDEFVDFDARNTLYKSSGDIVGTDENLGPVNGNEDGGAESWISPPPSPMDLVDPDRTDPDITIISSSSVSSSSRISDPPDVVVVPEGFR